MFEVLTVTTEQPCSNLCVYYCLLLSIVIYCVCEECVSKKNVTSEYSYIKRRDVHLSDDDVRARCVSRTVYLNNVNSRWTANTNNTRICPTLNNVKGFPDH